jgi:TonB family protein
MNRQDMCASFSQWLIRRAARRSPPALSQRLEEEWLADLAGRRGWSRLTLALGCSWATQVIAHDYSISRLAPASPAAIRAAHVPADHCHSPLPRRVIALLLIAGLHVAVIYTLATALMHSSTAREPARTDAVVLTELQPHASPPPRVEPHLVPAQVEIPDRVVPILAPGDDTIELPPALNPPQTPAGGAAKTVSRIAGGPALGFPNADDYYPLASKHLEEQGIATVQVCVDARGRLTANPTLVGSSGSARLDEASLRVARAGSGHYRPTTEDARPVSDCYAFRIRFELKN